MADSRGPLELRVRRVDWPLHEPFVIAGWRYESIETVEVEVRRGGLAGRGEAMGVDYLGEMPDDVHARIEAVAPQVRAGLDRRELQTLLPPGGARNALDCALWDLDAAEARCSVFDLLGVAVPGPFTTVGTLSLDSPDAMGAAAAHHADWPVLKLKLGGGDGGDVDRVRMVRAARPDAALLVDVNGAWDAAMLDAALDPLAALGIDLLEQPLPPGADASLTRGTAPIPICADESCQSRAELDSVADRYDVVNVKLDKTGGLTEALALVDAARARGLGLMVGNMCGSSLAMAPAMAVAAHCRFVDLDGPLLQSRDQPVPLRFDGARVAFADAWPWGRGQPSAGGQP